METDSLIHAKLVVGVVFVVLVATTMLIDSPEVALHPFVDQNTREIDGWSLTVPLHLMRRVHPGMTYEQVDAIIGPYYFDSDSDSDFGSDPHISYLDVTYGEWTVEFVKEGDGQRLVRRVRPAGDVSANNAQPQLPNRPLNIFD